MYMRWLSSTVNGRWGKQKTGHSVVFSTDVTYAQWVFMHV